MVRDRERDRERDRWRQREDLLKCGLREGDTERKRERNKMDRERINSSEVIDRERERDK